MNRFVWAATTLLLGFVAVCISGCNVRSEYDAPLIGKDDLDRLVFEAGLSAEQRAAAERLVADYAAEHQAALQKIQNYRSVYDKLVERGETPDLKADYKDTTERFERHCRALRDRFFEDARALLTPDQTAGWERYERWYRRKTLAPKGVLHGESVDVIAIAENQKPAVAQEPAVAEALAPYAVDLDAALMARQDAIAGAQFMAGADAAARERAEKRVRDQRARVRQLNFATARRVEGALEGEARASFGRSFASAAFPEVFGDGEIVNAMFAEVFSLNDLTESQRSEVGAVKKWYLAERPAVDRPWADAIKAAEDEEPVRVDCGPQAEGRQPVRVAEARRPRTELDLRCRAKLEEILTGAQLDRLPWLPRKPRLPRVEFE